MAAMSSLTTMRDLFSVVFPFGLPGSWDYYCPPPLLEKAHVGSRVVVPFQDRLCIGVIVKRWPVGYKTSVTLRPIWEVSDRPNLLPESYKIFFLQVSSYYLIDLSKVLAYFYRPIKHLFQFQLVVYPPLEKFPVKGALGDKQVAYLNSCQGLYTNWVKLNAKTEGKKLVHYFDILRASFSLSFLVDLVKALPTSFFFRSTVVRELREKCLEQLASAPKQRALLIHYWSILDKGEAPWQPKQKLLQGGASIGSLVALCKKGIFERKKMVGLSVEEPKSAPTSPTPSSKFVRKIREGWQKKEVVFLAGGTTKKQREVIEDLIVELLQEGRQVIWIVAHAARLQELKKKYQQLSYPVYIAENRLSSRNRLAIWWQLQQKKACLLITSLGGGSLILNGKPYYILEEESAFPKLSPLLPPLYARIREMLIMKSQKRLGKILLTSIHPSLISYYHGFVKKNYTYIALPFSEQPIKTFFGSYKINPLTHPDKTSSLISYRLYQFLEKQTALPRQQVLLLVSRKGVSPSLRCKSCKKMLLCPSCQANIAYHLGNQLICHRCTYQCHLPVSCFNCQANSQELTLQGVGIDRIQEVLQHLFPTLSHTSLELKKLPIPTKKTTFWYSTPQKLASFPFCSFDAIVAIDFDNWIYPPSLSAYENLGYLLSYFNQAAAALFLQSQYPLSNRLAHMVKNYRLGRGAHKELLEERACLGYPPYRRLIELFFSKKKASKPKKRVDQLENLLKQKKKEFVFDIIGPYPSYARKTPSLSGEAFLLKINSDPKQLQNIKHQLLLLKSRYSKDYKIEITIDPT